MKLSIRVAAVFGVPIRVHTTFGLLIVFLWWRTGATAGPKAALVQTLLVLLLFVFVVLHETGHAVAALRRGIPISEITLYPYGGVARIASRPRSGRTELEIAAAGPLVNLVLAALLALITWGAVLETPVSKTQQIVSFMFWSNLLLAGFNLLPAFPLDGGRVLRGALATRLGWTRATIWAASAGQVAAVVLMAVGALHDPWLLLGGVLLFPGANSELRLALGLRGLDRGTVRDVMLPEVQLVGPDAELRNLAQASRDAPISEFVVHDGVRATGYLPAARLWSVLRSPGGAGRTADDAAVPLADPIDAEETLHEALRRLESSGRQAATVVDARGAVIGVVTVVALRRARAIGRHLAKLTGGR